MSQVQQHPTLSHKAKPLDEIFTRKQILSV
jgi:hypothetical protein